MLGFIEDLVNSFWNQFLGNASTLDNHLKGLQRVYVKLKVMKKMSGLP